jgi:hypothetical protein
MPRDDLSPLRIEPRWPAIVAVAAGMLVVTLLPARIRLAPPWLGHVTGLGLLLPMIAVWVGGAKWWLLAVERATTLAGAVFVELITLATLAYVVVEITVRPQDVSGFQLLNSSVAAWTTNILSFSLIYWRIDRGGPEARANGGGRRVDWLFPQGDAPGAPAGWQPAYVDYLFLAFTTATAFSPTEALPLTPRAKLLMMTESSVSLTTLVVVASRAIGLLGG